jgi:hypothetical protein
MTERERDKNPVEDAKGRENAENAEKHAEESGIPTGATPEAVAEEEATGGALTNRDD